VPIPKSEPPKPEQTINLEIPDSKNPEHKKPQPTRLEEAGSAVEEIPFLGMGLVFSLALCSGKPFGSRAKPPLPWLLMKEPGLVNPIIAPSEWRGVGLGLPCTTAILDCHCVAPNVTKCHDLRKGCLRYGGQPVSSVA